MTQPSPVESGASKAALALRNLSFSFGAHRVLDDLSISVQTGEILALIGPNGAGKTTLFNVLGGFLLPQSGRLSLQGTELLHWPAPHRLMRHGIARSFQNLRIIGGMTTLENVLLACPRQHGESLWRLAVAPRVVGREDLANREKANGLLAQLGIGNKANEPAGRLSYGQQKLLCMACVLATDADILLLDEPVAGVNNRLVEVILELIQSLAAAGKSIILIEHDIRSVAQVAGRVVFLDTGRKVAEGSPEEVFQHPQVLEAYLQ